MAINPDAEQLHLGDNFLQGVLPNERNPLSWIGSSAAVWVEDDPFWKELAGKKTAQEREKFFEHNFSRLPIAVLIDVSNRLKLTAFLVGIRRGGANRAGNGRLGVALVPRPTVCKAIADRPRQSRPAENGQSRGALLRDHRRWTVGYS